MEKALMKYQVWKTILNSGFINEFASEKERNLTVKVDAKFKEIDSTIHAQRDNIGKIGGFRNDQFEYYLGEMMKEYIRKNDIRVVHIPTM